MSKRQIIKRIIATLADSLAVLQKAARTAHAEATHESSKAENKYDTRGLEAAYLAGGQARQAKETLESIAIYERLVTRDFGPDEPIGLTALVELEADGAHSYYFLGPRNGGLEIQSYGREIMVITAESPLGENLMGRKAGARWSAQVNGARVNYHIVSVV